MDSRRCTALAVFKRIEQSLFLQRAKNDINDGSGWRASQKAHTHTQRRIQSTSHVKCLRCILDIMVPSRAHTHTFAACTSQTPKSFFTRPMCAARLCVCSGQTTCGCVCVCSLAVVAARRTCYVVACFWQFGAGDIYQSSSPSCGKWHKSDASRSVSHTGARTHVHGGRHGARANVTG